MRSRRLSVVAILLLLMLSAAAGAKKDAGGGDGADDGGGETSKEDKGAKESDRSSDRDRGSSESSSDSDKDEKPKRSDERDASSSRASSDREERSSGPSSSESSGKEEKSKGRSDEGDASSSRSSSDREERSSGPSSSESSGKDEKSKDRSDDGDASSPRESSEREERSSGPSSSESSGKDEKSKDRSDEGETSSSRAQDPGREREQAEDEGGKTREPSPEKERSGDEETGAGADRKDDGESTSDDEKDDPKGKDSASDDADDARDADDADEVSSREHGPALEDASPREAAKTEKGPEADRHERLETSSETAPRDAVVPVVADSPGRFSVRHFREDAPVKALDFEAPAEVAQVRYHAPRSSEGPRLNIRAERFSIEVTDEAGAHLNATNVTLMIPRARLPEGTPHVLHFESDGRWHPLPTLVTDEAIIAESPHFSYFAIAGSLEDAVIATAYPLPDSHVNNIPPSDLSVLVLTTWNFTDAAFLVENASVDPASTYAIAGKAQSVNAHVRDMPDGPRTVVFNATLDGSRTLTVAWNFTLDRADPVLTELHTAYVNGTGLLDVDWTDASPTTAEVYVDGNLSVKLVAPGRVDLGQLSAGSHDVKVHLVDAAGNRVAGPPRSLSASVVSMVEAQGESSRTLVPEMSAGLVLLVGSIGTVLVGRHTAAVARRPSIQSGASAVEHCDVCLGRYKLPQERYGCPCGVSMHSSCYLRVGQCPACQRTDGIVMGDAG